MTVIMTILGIIGRILLILLVLVLLILTLILAVPIRYRISGSGDTEEKIFAANVRFTWMLSALSLKVHLEKEDPQKPVGRGVEFTIFGINPRKRRLEKAEKKKQLRREEKKKKLDEIRREQPTLYEEMKAEAKLRREEKEARKEKLDEELRLRKQREKEELARAEHRQQRLEIRFRQSAGIIERIIRAAAAAVADFFMGGVRLLIILSGVPVRLTVFIGRMAEKSASSVGKCVSFLSYLTDPRTGGALLTVRRTLLKILKHILPRSFRGSLRFGFSDPAFTGQILALFSIFYPRYAGRLTLEPDFENAAAAGALSMKGYIRLGSLTGILIAALLNKDLRRQIHLFRNRNKDKEDEQ